MVEAVMPRREAVGRSNTSSPGALRLLIARNIGECGQLLQFGEHLRGIGIQFVGIRVFQRVLELSAADAVVHGQILHRLHVKRDSGDFRECRLQAADHIAGADAAVGQRLQIDLHAAVVHGGVGAVDADE